MVLIQLVLTICWVLEKHWVTNVSYYFITNQSIYISSGIVFVYLHKHEASFASLSMWTTSLWIVQPWRSPILIRWLDFSLFSCCYLDLTLFMTCTIIMYILCKIQASPPKRKILGDVYLKLCNKHSAWHRPIYS